MPDSIRWLDWTGATFAKAAATHRPVLLSLVTSWSEECRAMDRITFSHPEVVAELSSHFVTVRVDADRQPDVNERYNLGGWPTTAFLTSDGQILSGSTFLGPEQMLASCRHVAAAWRERASDFRAHHFQTRMATPTAVGAAGTELDRRAIDSVRSLIVGEFDAVHGGFGTAPKLPHTAALLLALSLSAEEGGTGDPELAGIVETTLDKMSALWDSTSGGFHRYADEADWSRPGTEKMLEDNAALLHLYVEASLLRGSQEFRDRAGQLVRWVKSQLADEHAGGFYNARCGAVVDRSMYVDRNAQMVAAFLRAAAFFDDPWLRDFGLKSLETVLLPGYAPGKGAAHTMDGAVRDLLTDQVHASSAAIWAHAVTAQLPYSMLAAELMQFAIRTMWDESANAFRDRVSPADPLTPFLLNCEAACVLDRLAAVTGQPAYRDRAVAILGTLAPEYSRHGLFAATYALAMREVIDGSRPAGLELTKVDWCLEPPTS